MVRRQRRRQRSSPGHLDHFVFSAHDGLGMPSCLEYDTRWRWWHSLSLKIVLHTDQQTGVAPTGNDLIAVISEIAIIAERLEGAR
jgi:hypothetical protein